VPSLRPRVQAAAARTHLLQRECRYASEHAAPTVQIADPDAVDRLFDPSRDPGEHIRDDDWHLAQPEGVDDTTWQMFAELDSFDTVAQRRRLYSELKRSGEIA
jgi:hypothetical protein